MVVNFIRNMIAMQKKRAKNNKESEIQSLKLKQSYKKLAVSIAELNNIINEIVHKE